MFEISKKAQAKVAATTGKSMKWFRDNDRVDEYDGDEYGAESLSDEAVELALAGDDSACAIAIDHMVRHNDPAIVAGQVVLVVKQDENNLPRLSKRWLKRGLEALMRFDDTGQVEDFAWTISALPRSKTKSYRKSRRVAARKRKELGIDPDPARSRRQKEAYEAKERSLARGLRVSRHG